MPTVHTNPSRKLSFSKTLFKPEEFKNAGFGFLCGLETFWKRSFLQMMTSRWSRDFLAHVFLKQIQDDRRLLRFEFSRTWSGRKASTCFGFKSQSTDFHLSLKCLPIACLCFYFNALLIYVFFSFLFFYDVTYVLNFLTFVSLFMPSNCLWQWPTRKPKLLWSHSAFYYLYSNVEILLCKLIIKLKKKTKNVKYST